MKRAPAVTSLACALPTTPVHATGELSRCDCKGGSHVAAGILAVEGAAASAVECLETE
jgi:hypothetical protein